MPPHLVVLASLPWEVGETGNFAFEVAENLRACREPPYPPSGWHRGYEQDGQRQITTGLSAHLSVTAEFIFVTRGPKVGYETLPFPPGFLL